MASFLSFLLGEKKKTASVAKERPQIILAHERSGLLRDITGLLSNEKINVLAVNTQTDKKQHIARMTFTLEIPDVAMLSRVLALLDQIPNVMDVRRRSH